MQKNVKWLPLLLLTACSPRHAEEKQKIEVMIRSVRTDLEEVKQDVTTQKAKIELLENQISQEEKALSQLKKELLAPQEKALSVLKTQVEALSSLSHEEKEERENLSQKIQSLTTQAAIAEKKLSQYKKILMELENEISSPSSATKDPANQEETAVVDKDD